MPLEYLFPDVHTGTIIHPHKMHSAFSVVFARSPYHSSAVLSSPYVLCRDSSVPYPQDFAYSSQIPQVSAQAGFFLPGQSTVHLFHFLTVDKFWQRMAAHYTLHVSGPTNTLQSAQVCPHILFVHRSSARHGHTSNMHPLIDVPS